MNEHPTSLDTVSDDNDALRSSPRHSFSSSSQAVLSWSGFGGRPDGRAGMFFFILDTLKILPQL